MRPMPRQEKTQRLGFHCSKNDIMSVPFIFLWAIFLGSLSQPAWTHAEETWFFSTVTISDDSVATLTADVMLAAPPETVYAVLSDYPNWPDLFGQRPTINTIQREGNRVRVDMTLTVSFLPIGLRLVTDTRELATIILQTTLVEGDFKQYDWIWTIRPSKDSQHTKASVMVHVQPSVWIPHWLFEWSLTWGFTEHFHKLREAVQVRHREQGITPMISAPSKTP
jgi:ribosome-associated toxin RatA of RatAB toxin-antitoxin module